LDNNIQPDKLIINEKVKTEAPSQSQDKAAIVKESLPIGKILQNTIKQLSTAGLESINVVKVMASAKGLFPSEYSQVQLQQRQAQIDNPETKATTTYKAVSDTTKNNWFNGQVVHAKVLETHPGGRATLLIDKHVVEVKLESNSQLKLQAGQSLALVIEKETKQQLPKTNNTTNSAALNKEGFNTNQTITKESVSTDRAVTKEPATSVKAVTREAVTPDKAITKEPVTSVKAVTKEPITPVKSVTKEAVSPDKVVTKEPTTPDKPITKEPITPVKAVTKEAVSPDKVVTKEPPTPDKPITKEPVTPVKAVTREAVSPDKVVTKEPITPDKPVTKEPVAPNKAVIKEPLASDKAVTREAVNQTNRLTPPSIDKTHYVSPSISEKLTYTKIANSDQATQKEVIYNEKIANTENLKKERIPPKETVSTEKIRFILSNPPEQSSKLIQLIQSMVVKQQSLSPLLASLDSVFQYTHSDKTNSSTISQTGMLNSNKLPIPLVNAIQQLLNKVSSTQQLSMRDGLKQAIINSGLFLENRLQIQKTDNIDLNSLLLNPKVTKNRFQSALRFSKASENTQALSQTLNKLSSASQKFSGRINSSVSIPAEVVQLLNKNMTTSLQSTMQLKNPPVDINQVLNKNQQITNKATTINELLSKLNIMNQHVEKAITQSTAKNFYPKDYSQSINQVLETISKQFNEQNQSLLASKSHSYARTQATQFSAQIQQINQVLSQAITNNNPQTNINPQINDDLKLNLQRLLSVLQEVSTADKSQAQINTNLNKLSPSLLQQITSHESELNRQPLATRNKHAQVTAAQQNQLLQIANPLVFQQTLADQIEGVMSRIIATQAATREQADSNVNMSLEIPFKFQEKSQVLQLKFTSEDKNKEKSKEKIWSANLAFELQSLGAIRIYIILDGKDVSMQFWTEKETTQQIFAKNFSMLRDRLKLAGYNISEMTASLGIPQEAEEESTKTKNGVIDEHV